MKNYIRIAVLAAFVAFPVISSAHVHQPIVSCKVPVVDVPVVATPEGGGGMIYGSGPFAPGWKASEHSNYIPYNGTTCLFSQGCILPTLR